MLLSFIWIGIFVTVHQLHCKLDKVNKSTHRIQPNFMNNRWLSNHIKVQTVNLYLTGWVVVTFGKWFLSKTITILNILVRILRGNHVCPWLIIFIYSICSFCYLHWFHTLVYFCLSTGFFTFRLFWRRWNTSFSLF